MHTLYAYGCEASCVSGLYYNLLVWLTAKSIKLVNLALIHVWALIKYLNDWNVCLHLLASDLWTAEQHIQTSIKTQKLGPSPHTEPMRQNWVQIKQQLEREQKELKQSLSTQPVTPTIIHFYIAFFESQAKYVLNPNFIDLFWT